MSQESTARPRVLVVDDEDDVAEAYAMKVRDRYDTEIAYGGEEALEKIDQRTAAVLLDRRMPDIHGDDVLAEIRDRGYDGAVIMVTAVDPDLNILEMDFDDYLCKPVGQTTLLTTLDQHVDASTTDPRLDEFFAILSKLTVLENEMTPSELDGHDEFNRLKHRAIELNEELRESVDDFEEIVETYQSLDRSSGRTL